MTAPIEYLEEDQLFSVLSSISKPRDAIIVGLLYELGCALKELVSIRVRDIDFQAHTIIIGKKNSRGNKERIVTVSPSIIRQIAGYLEQQSLLDKRLAYLFQTARKTPLTPRRIFQIVERCLLDAEITVKPTPQLIKYTHIVHAYQHNIPLAEIERHVGIQKQRLAQIFDQVTLTHRSDPYASFFRRLENKKNAQ